MINGNAKGKAGEREFADFLRKHGINARRGQQFSGGADSPDIISDIPFHIEVKRTEKLRLYPAMDQAKKDADDKIPIVVHRSNRRPWVVVMDAEDFLKIIDAVYGIEIREV